MEGKFNGTASLSGVLKFVEVIQNFKNTHTHTHMHTHTNTHTHADAHVHTSYVACKLLKTFKIGWYDENEIQFPLSC
jgi:hypothetical protein